MAFQSDRTSSSYPLSYLFRSVGTDVAVRFHLEPGTHDVVWVPGESSDAVIELLVVYPKTYCVAEGSAGLGVVLGATVVCPLACSMPSLIPQVGIQ